ncbi:hypothetical protein [Flavobacterium sp.]|uniref:hypothetical protein n=1 Tax=Flavobacterium sp. TaxID=239 RepID=UPI002603D833|nr:hypothetical protein [Flavobacterium sp.]
MKKNTFLLIIVILLSSCSPEYYIYKLQLKKPTVSNELKFEDEKLIVEFLFMESEVALKIMNKSDKPLKINWDEASFVYNGEAQKIIHKNVKYIDKEKLQAPTVIPPKSFILDFVQPIDDIKYNQSSFSHDSYWSNKPIFPIISYYNPKDKERIERAKKVMGNNIKIYIPILQDGKSFDYYFEMEVNDIHYKKSKNQTESIF